MVLFALPLLTAQAQEFVYPERPAQSNVRYYGFDWKILTMSVPTEQGDIEVRLYFYEQERMVAELARAQIESAVTELASTFAHAPTQPIPYVLYSSYQEFLRTNLFPVQEGVLGVTSPQNLKLALPYFGDHRLFADVSTHELAHEFTIQKVNAVGAANKALRDPLDRMPLWFIEGLAEYYAQGGIDPEAEMRVRDLLANPDPYKGHFMGDFFSSFPGTTLWIYKVGQMRIAYLEEIYGQGTTQRILDECHRLVGTAPDPDEEPRDPVSFQKLVEQITGDKEAQISDGFDHWIKRRAFTRWLQAEQDRPDVLPLKQTRGQVMALAAHPEGDFLAYRSIESETGRSRLFVVDPEASEHPKRVASDGVPGFETLHPVDNRNFSVGKERLVFVSESRGHDVLNVVSVTRKVKREGDGEDEPPRVRFKTKREQRIRLAAHDLIAAYSPALSPDEQQVAFVGLDRRGIRDVYVADLMTHEVRPITDDVYSEREVAWGTGGIVFSSDATETGRTNLFWVTGDGAIERLTVEDLDHHAPLVTVEGEVIYTAIRDGASNLFQVTDDGAAQLTDLATGVYEPAAGPSGDVWALHQFEGSKQPVRLTKGTLNIKQHHEYDEAEPAQPPPSKSTVEALPYRPWQLRNWAPETVFGFLGIAGRSIYGQIYLPATDKLRNHSVVLDLRAYGSFELTEGVLFYANQARRVTWGGGPFQSPSFRWDQTFDDLRFSSYEQFYGGMGSVRFPFDRFAYVQTDVRMGAVRYLISTGTAEALDDEGRLDEWLDANEGTRSQGELGMRVGVDTIRYHRRTGPLAGRSALLQGTIGAQPTTDVLYGTLQLNAEQYVPIAGAANLFLRGGAGGSLESDFARYFYLYSFETLRGVNFGDPEFLLGRHFFFTTAELQLPLDPLLNLYVAQGVEAVAGVDFGSVSEAAEDILEVPVLDVVLGGNLIVGPLVFKLHFARPLDIGVALPDDGWVTNFSLGWLYQ